MKAFLLRWAAKQFVKILNNDQQISYAKLDKYGVEDIVTGLSGEKMIVFHGLKIRPQFTPTKKLGFWHNLWQNKIRRGK